MSIPRLVVAGVRSGSGKTTITAALVTALRRRGLAVQTFKAGPDYIDPSFLTSVSGRPCRNLDSFLLSETTIRELFHRAVVGADVAVIEGVMGLFDAAAGAGERGSTAHLAKILRAGVVVVLDASKAGRSVAAVAHGFAGFDEELDVAGFVVNHVGSESHDEMIRSALAERPGRRVFGAFRRGALPELPSRHLGLVPAWERQSLSTEDLAEAAEASLDVDGLITAAKEAPPLEQSAPVLFARRSAKEPRVRIAYALDDAFHFYYQDNLDYLEHLGAELVPFSPLSDREIPADVGGVYFGGGYPELQAAALYANAPMISAVRSASLSNMPMLAECGGLMYLVEELVDQNGVSYEEVGVFRATISMRKRLSALGYYRAQVIRPIPWAPDVRELRGHVYHWSEMTANQHEAIFRLQKRNRPSIPDGFVANATLASYLHVHFGACPEFAAGFVQAARQYRLQEATGL